MPVHLLAASILESLPGFLNKRKPYLFFQARETKLHRSPAPLALFQVLLKHLGLSPPLPYAVPFPGFI